MRHGCELCRQYGDGQGQLLKEYSNTEVTINGKLYKPKCHFCKGRRQASYVIWDQRLVDDGCSDYGENNMPHLIFPCHLCDEANHTVLYDIAQEEVLSNPIKPNYRLKGTGPPN
jgi:hypothetical protein